MIRKILLLLLFIVASAQVVAQINEVDRTSLASGDLRMVNALVGVGPVDVYVNDRLVSIALAPEEATAYLSVPAGRYTIAVYPTGASPLSIPVADILLDLPQGQSKTAVVYQSRFAETLEEGETAPDTFNATGTSVYAQSGTIMVLDDNRTPLELGQARLTAVHLSPGSPEKISVAYPSRASLLHEIEFGIPYGEIDIDAGVYPITLVDSESSTLERLSFINEQILDANVHYTLIIVPDIAPITESGDPELNTLEASPRFFVVEGPIDPPDDGFQLRLIHAAPDTQIVDVYVDGELTAPRFTYGNYTQYIGLSSFSHLIELRARDAQPDSTPLATASIEISDQNRNQPHWSLLLLNGNDSAVPALELTQAEDPVMPPGSSGQTGEPAPQIFNTAGGRMMMALLPDNVAQTSRGEARVRLIHAIDGALEISLWASEFPMPVGAPTPTPQEIEPTPLPPVRLIDPVVYGAEANEDEVPEGLYPELIFIAGNSTELITLEEEWLLSGLVHTFVLIGLPSGEPPIEVLHIKDYGRGIPQERLYLGVITSNVGIANIRRQPSDAAGILDQLATGMEVEVLGRNFDGTWIKIRYMEPGNTTPQDGWIFGEIIQVTRLGDPINLLALPPTN